MSHISLKQSKRVVTATAGAFVLFGLVAGFKSENPLGKNLAWLVAAASAFVAIGNEVATSFHEETANLQAQKIISARDKKISSLQLQLDNASGTLTTKVQAEDDLKKALAKKESTLEKITEERNTLVAELVKIQKLRTADGERFDEAFCVFINRIKASLTAHVNDNLKRLLSTVNNRIKLIKKKQKSNESEHILSVLTELIEEITHKKEEHIQWVNELAYNPHTDINTTLIDALDLITQIHEEIQSTRSKYRNTLVISDRLKLRESVHKEQALNALQKLKATADQELENINQKTAEYEEVTRNNDAFVQNLIKDFETLRLRLAEKDDVIKELRSPIRWKFSLNQATKTGNIIITWCQGRGIHLDRSHYTGDRYEADLYFFTDRINAAQTIDLKTLNEEGENLAQLAHCLQPIKFSYEYDTRLVVAHIVMLRKDKKPKTEDEINKIWIPANKFESYVRSWERVRITAGSTGGKSPTAKNLALAIMHNRKGQGEIRLYDPQHGSKKDFWNMPKAGTSHEDNIFGMKELCNLINERRNEKNHQFILYIFDEIDNTVAQFKDDTNFSDLIKIALKEGSHASLGAIFIGQSCDVTEVPGMTHSNWNNAVQLHIGSNAGLFLDRLATIPNEDKTRLLEQYRKIQEFCDEKNSELGLDIFSDATAYRFALAVPLTGLPKFIQLPDFDTYDYESVMGDLTATQTIENNNKPEDSSLEISCPHCGSTDFRSQGDRWKCKNNSCLKTWIK